MSSFIETHFRGNNFFSMQRSRLVLRAPKNIWEVKFGAFFKEIFLIKILLFSWLILHPSMRQAISLIKRPTTFLSPKIHLFPIRIVDPRKPGPLLEVSSLSFGAIKEKSLRSTSRKRKIQGWGQWKKRPGKVLCVRSFSLALLFICAYESESLGGNLPWYHSAMCMCMLVWREGRKKHIS